MHTPTNRVIITAALVAAVFGFPLAGTSGAAATCDATNTIVADVVALDQPLVFNRIGAQNVNGMIFALRGDVVDLATGRTEAAGGVLSPGAVGLRPDKRPRPLVLRAAAGSCIAVNFQNLLSPGANPFNAAPAALMIDEQAADRYAGFHAQGMQLVGDNTSDASFVGRNPNGLVLPGASKSYTLFAEHEGTFLVSSYGAVLGSEGTQGNSANGLFGAINVEPKNARFYRSQVTEEDLRLATRKNPDGSLATTAAGQPVVDYEALYPASEPWISEGKAGMPILRMTADVGNTSGPATGAIVHSDINAVVAGPCADGSWTCTFNTPAAPYPLEKAGVRNPTVPNRLDPFREFTVIFHDETAAAQAFPGFYRDDPVFRYVLEGVRDGFMINYGSGGVGSEIIANRLGVGPMHDCLDCAYEEFFLTSYAVGDPAMLVDIPANVGLETLLPGQAPPAGTTGIKATRAFYPDDPSNVHHSYINDFTKFRNLHIGKEQHVFHLHNHQWLYSASDADGNYLDAQGIGPGAGYTYEINFGGSGNRNKSAGDAIFHCHFYPHFAQGMWELWRHHDVFEAGTALAASGAGFHAAPFALADGTPAAFARALPDGEIVAGTPIPALVPLPGKPMALMPGRVSVTAKVVGGVTVGSIAQVDRTDTDPALASPMNPAGLKNPGFPFWIAGIEQTVGQRPPTPPLDMFHGTKLLADGTTITTEGWDGGLPRHALDGIAASGHTPADPSFVSVVNKRDLSKEVHRAKAVFFPEEGTDVEKAAMDFHATTRAHASYALLPGGAPVAGDFITNGGGVPGLPGAPFHEPCIDDNGKRLLSGVTGSFFSGGGLGALDTHNLPSRDIYTANSPRIYKGTNIQFDAVFNKVGYHYPQERIVTLWQDAVPTINKQKAPEPLVIRLNTFDCAMYEHTNLVPKNFEMDDYQIKTPTDIIGQHIHLPKWDLTTTDGSGNGWNYEDGTLSPGAVQERIEAINAFNPTGAGNPTDSAGRAAGTPLVAQPHPFFRQFNRPDWLGARTTLQRWFSDPVVNIAGEHRGLGIIFTHDHYGPSTHQQIGLYATVLTEPPGSTWVHNETGVPLYSRPDGGPTSWQAAILPPAGAPEKPYREFYFEYSDFQHAYEAGTYVGAGPDGKPNPSAFPATADTFRKAINPPTRAQITPVFPDLVLEAIGGIVPGCPERPCPQAISVQDPGMLVTNYRNEPVGLRVYDPNRLGPDGKPGSQAAGLAGDLAFALQTRTDRKIAALNTRLGTTPYPALTNDIKAGDPFTPIVRAYAGDLIRIKVQAGAHEEEFNSSIHAAKWLQGGSGYGSSPTSGWRNAQAAGISEQFTFSAPIAPVAGTRGNSDDYAYSNGVSTDGWWSGVWGIMRSYNNARNDLFRLPNTLTPLSIANPKDWNGVCPVTAPARSYDITAILANQALGNSVGATIVPAGPAATQHVGGALNPAGGTLVYNPRNTAIPATTFVNDAGQTVTIGGNQGPLHDPTAILYVRTADLDAAGKLKAGVPVEPLVLRAAAGECINVTLRNRLPGDLNGNGIFDDNPDLANYGMLQGVVKRDRNNPQGATTFNNNLIRPSSYVGIHPQLVAYDVSRADGAQVGVNANELVAPGGQKTVQWYAGDIAPTISGSAYRLTGTPVEFGGANLTPADKIKQGQKSMVGMLIVEPQGATLAETDTAWDHQTADPAARRATRASATIDKGKSGEFRDFATVMSKALNMRYKDGQPVEHLNGEGVGIPEDSQDDSHMAINYGSEPLWYRFAVPPNAPFGRAAGAGFGDIANAHEAFSNGLAGVGADPATPVFTAAPGQPFRMRLGVPHGTSRGTTFHLHGHVWQRAPYRAQNTDPVTGLPNFLGPGVGSVKIGDNPISNYQSGQESLTPYAHFDLVLPGAGGVDAVPGDYLFRDMAGFGGTSGLWGIVRVQ